MPVVSFSERDLLKGKPVEPAWYRVKIDAVGEQLSKDQKSTNYPVEATIIKNADTGDTKFAGYPIEYNFNSKAMGFSRGYLESLGVNVEANKKYELSNTAGMELEMFVGNKEYQGRIVNDYPHQYRPVAENRQ